MSVRRYTSAQLLHLRDSPLVHKPDNLPAIEQWLEYVYLEDNGVRERLRIPHSEAAQPAQRENGTTGSNPARPVRQPRAPLSTAAGAGGESSPMGAFSTGQRPGLLQMRSKTGEDSVLGPPKSTFPSSRNTSKLAGSHDRTTSVDVTSGDEPETARSRFFADRQMNRRTADKEGGETRNTWGNNRDRRTLGDQDETRGEGRERNDRYGRYDKDHDGERRNGHGEKHDSRWGAREDKRMNGDKPLSWREREQQRRDAEGGHVEKDPAWMEDPVMKKDEELGMGMPKTAEEFELWRAAMRDKAKPQASKDQVVEAPAAPLASPEPKPVKAPLKLEGFDANALGGWVASKGAPVTPGETGQTPKPAAKAAKTSRYASIFKPTDEPVSVVEDAKSQVASTSGSKASNEERTDFDRVLAMLGGVKIGLAAAPTQSDMTPASPPPAKATGTNGEGAKPKSRFFGAREPEKLQSPELPADSLNGVESMFNSSGRGVSEDHSTSVNNRVPGREASEQHLSSSGLPTGSSESAGPFNAFREQQSRPQSGRITDLSAFDPPSRRAATPDENIQNLLAQQRQKPQATRTESQALLSLLTKPASTTRVQQQLPPNNNSGVDASHLHRWFESQQGVLPSEPHAPKPRLPQPAGLFEEQLMRNFPPEQQPLRHEQQHLPPQMHAQQQQQQMQQEMPPQRRPSQRAPPPGFYDEQQMFLQQQQQLAQQQHQQTMRRMAGPHQPPHQMPNPGPGQQPQSYYPDHLITSLNTAGAQPPPGFHPQMPRHPPGLNSIPNIFQPPQSPNGVGQPPPGFFNGGAPPGLLQRGVGGGRGFEGYTSMR